jgi:hypothetical protein
MRPQSITDLSQRCMDDVSWGQEVGRRLSGRLIWCVRKFSQAFAASAIVLNGGLPNVIAGPFNRAARKNLKAQRPILRSYWNLEAVEKLAN